MSAPIVFISHLRVIPDKLDAYAQMTAEWVSRFKSEKPRTAGFLHYVDRQASRVTVVHLFADAAAMDLHFEGADERSKVAWEVMTPDGWEIYGPASESAVASLRRQAESAGVALTVQPEFVAGFLRLAAD